MTACKEENTGWIKMGSAYNSKDEYKLFSGPHGRRIVARLNKYKSGCFVLRCLCGVQFAVIIWVLYLLFGRGI